MGEERLDFALLVDLWSHVGQAHHDRYARAVDIGVEQADPGASAGEADSEVHRDRGFADAALASAHADDVGDSGQLASVG